MNNPPEVSHSTSTKESLWLRPKPLELPYSEAHSAVSLRCCPGNCTAAVSSGEPLSGKAAAAHIPPGQEKISSFLPYFFLISSCLDFISALLKKKRIQKYRVTSTYNRQAWSSLTPAPSLPVAEAKGSFRTLLQPHKRWG